MLSIDARRDNLSPEIIYDIRTTDSLNSDCEGRQFELEYMMTKNVRLDVESLAERLQLIGSSGSEDTYSERGWYSDESSLCRAISDLFESQRNENVDRPTPNVCSANVVGQGVSTMRNHRLCN